MTDGLIELGERAGVEGPVERVRRRHPRLWAALAMVAVLFGVAGSGGLPPRLSGPMWTVADVDGFWLGRDTTYVLTNGNVEARAADTGQLRWQRPAGGRIADLVEIDSRLMVIYVVAPAAPPNSDTGDDGGQDVGSRLDVTTLVRVATGDAVATAGGRPLAWSTDRLLVGHDGCDGRVRCSTLSAIRLPDATPDWSLAVPTVRGFGLDQAAGVFSLQTVDEVQLRDWTTGAPLRSADLTQEKAITQDGASAEEKSSGLAQEDRTTTYALVVAGRLLIVRRAGDQIIVAGQPIASAAGAWSLTLPAVAGQPTSGFLHAAACGPLLCLYADAGTAVIDPATGALRGTLPGYVVPSSYSGATDEYLIVEPLDGNSTGVRLFRAADLSAVASLPFTTMITWRASGGRFMVSRFVVGGISLAVVDQRGYQRTIGTISGSEVLCGAYQLILTCVDQRGLTAWRIPDAAELAVGVGNAGP